MNPHFSRRTLLRGAGVALALPWLESLAPRQAFAQAATRRRYMALYIPNGVSENWKPTTTGGGSSWQLSPVLAPLQALKSKIILLSGLENGTSFNANGSSFVDPAHGRQPGAWLTCVDPGVISQTKGAGSNVQTLDQTMAATAAVRAGTPLPSLQVGLSTWYSYCDKEPCANSRSVSWNSAGKPMYKLVDPLEVFNKLTSLTGTMTGGGAMPDLEAQKRVALNKSVLDAVLENATRTQSRLGAADRARLDEFLTSVRTVEKSATSLSSGMGGLACMAPAKPTMAKVLPDMAKQNTATYNKGTHADVMNDLIVMAYQCDATRIITHMLEDERSEFTYSHVPRRTWTATGSSPASGTCPEYHNGGQHGSQDDFATITWWNVGKVAELCAKLDAIKEGDASVLDNSVIFFSSCMHGSNHACGELPVMLIGGGGGKLKTDQHIVYQKRWLRDLHYTMMKNVYGMAGAGVDDFGTPRPEKPASLLREILSA
jgi:hypothetical protein